MEFNVFDIKPKKDGDCYIVNSEQSKAIIRGLIIYSIMEMRGAIKHFSYEDNEAKFTADIRFNNGISYKLMFLKEEKNCIIVMLLNQNEVIKLKLSGIKISYLMEVIREAKYKFAIYQLNMLANSILPNNYDFMDKETKETGEKSSSMPGKIGDINFDKLD